jgi:hypothetical protein
MREAEDCLCMCLSLACVFVCLWHGDKRHRCNSAGNLETSNTPGACPRTRERGECGGAGGNGRGGTNYHGKVAKDELHLRNHKGGQGLSLCLPLVTFFGRIRAPLQNSNVYVHIPVPGSTGSVELGVEPVFDSHDAHTSVLSNLVETASDVSDRVEDDGLPTEVRQLRDVPIITPYRLFDCAREPLESAPMNKCVFCCEAHGG